MAAGGSEKVLSIVENEALLPGGISVLGAGVGRLGDIVVMVRAIRNTEEMNSVERGV